MQVKREGQPERLERGDLVIHVYSRPHRFNGGLAVVEQYVPAESYAYSDSVRIQWLLPATPEALQKPAAGTWVVDAWEKVGHLDDY